MKSTNENRAVSMRLASPNNDDYGQGSVSLKSSLINIYYFANTGKIFATHFNVQFLPQPALIREVLPMNLD